MSILEKLYRGEVLPRQTSYKSIEDEYDAFQKFCLAEKKFMETLNENQIELFKNFQEAETQLNELNNSEAFANGFSLGVKMITESMTR